MSINRKSSSTVEVPREGFGLTLTSANQSAYPVLYTDDVWEIVANNTEISKVVSAVTGSVMNGTYAEKDIIEAIATVLVKTKKTIDDALSGSGSIEDLINEALRKLDAEVSGTDNGVSVKVKQVDGVITEVVVTAPDNSAKYDPKGAAAAVLGTPSDTSGNKTVYGAFAAVKDAKDALNNKIDDLNADVTGSDKGITVTVSQEKGLLKSVIVENGLVGEPTDDETADTIYGAKAAAKKVLGKETDTASDKTVYGAFAAINEVKESIDKMSGISEDKIRSLFCN